MKAARAHDGASTFAIDEIDEPVLAPGEVLVEVKACGLCGSDLHILDGVTAPAFRPITLGHESAGIVRRTSSAVTDAAVGDRVFVNPLIACGRCEPCRRGRSHICVERSVLGIHRDGAFAELMSVPAANLVPLPAALPFEQAAMIESASVPFHALTRRAPVQAGDAVAVIGVGGLGSHALQIAQLLGATRVFAIDIDAAALRRASASSDCVAVDARTSDPVTTVRRLADGGVDVVLDTVGRPATGRWAVELLRPGGIAALAGIGGADLLLPSSSTFARGEIELRGVYGYAQDQCARVASLIASGQLDVRGAIGEVQPLEAINTGLAHFRRASGAPIRVVIVPS
ncbi:zinc-binding dehydrogenase [Conexibacter sp. CPCC 206217]|uniref:zinc-dependent alcohol dehydrogenase n=1 Tax=Conexibacter sp. CPCC 206217 TaxID=3064574 RepID=UPI00271935A9|nr:alcohol dehydrogenase catalytic domain-containing protein [Conexibacter sp. CPCC 206217]MDO8210144.1 alcohol dehydrogenase catalytic domain-containing protein [Conexibacter sp. CPCC 206217]